MVPRVILPARKKQNKKNRATLLEACAWSLQFQIVFTTNIRNKIESYRIKSTIYETFSTFTYLCYDLFAGSTELRPELTSLVTGLAIADTHDTLSLYFGCYSERGLGGLGLGILRIQHNGLVKDVFPVTSASAGAYGSGVFVAEKVGKGCPVTGGYTTIDGLGPEPTGASLATRTVGSTKTLGVYLTLASILDMIRNL